MKRNNKKGFTIVELVIVIAVIGILAAVLIPTFSGIIADANANAALQEARNAHTQYLIDSDADMSNLVIVVDDTNYFTVTNGQIAAAASEPEHHTTDLDGNANNDVELYLAGAHETGTGDCSICGEEKTPQS